MGEVVSLASYGHKKAADRGFREWRRIFGSIMDFDEKTLWADLPDEVLLFCCEDSPGSRHGFYDLIMGSRRLGSGHDFETQHLDRLTTLMNAYFFIMDQARFECMRRLGWVETVPRAGEPIIKVVIESESYDYASLLEAPAPTSEHPAYEEDRLSRGIDRAALVRKHFMEAVRIFKERVRPELSAGP